MSSPEVVDAAAEVLGGRASRNEPLAPPSTYRAGGPAALFLEVDDASDLHLLVETVAGTGIDVLVVGNGSNLLVCDRGFPGLAVRMNAGGHGSELSETLVGVHVLDLRTGKDGVVPAADLHLGYRRSDVGPGRRRGTAEVSDKHADFIRAGSSGSAGDVFALMVEVRDAVEAHSGVRLHPENGPRRLRHRAVRLMTVRG